eukprot:TRINITY_DN14834_c0_g1::TRINITY_DN14834_c0_g1_i1::g.16286::m.16286 TRINITY_DN14834_c0_g1::TRINITY_DN14834_c0_g1_i1::g.16286  ORF type:complete len:218 (-),score=81.04,sp/Q86AQ7/VAM7B_DICDI/62.37/1e-85,Synaptobrevin/PF00957.16/6.3e+03,Synaptobrevin/PF00957.16/1.5e-34,Longin/PF13774.1/2e-23,DUF1798/PF08807.5/0.022,UvsY/PF11056.3/0.17,DUF16/PF01519.11/0.23 TRINITY_DN14834_c0_g1_i1:594-1247(-)
MPIIYSLVARGSCVLAEFTTTSGNFTTVTRCILEKIQQRDGAMSYVYNKHVFHILIEDSLTYLCMADEEFGRRLPFAFLHDIKERFRSTYADSGKTALAYAMNEDFSKVLAKQMDFYSNNPNADKVTKVQKEIDEVKTVMVHNIEKVLERGEKIELLVDKTENLNQQAFMFKKQATRLKHAMWWKNAKLMALLVFVVLFLLWLLISIICGFNFKKCK